MPYSSRVLQVTLLLSESKAFSESINVKWRVVCHSALCSRMILSVYESQPAPFGDVTLQHPSHYSELSLRAPYLVHLEEWYLASCYSYSIPFLW
jgi:hypothetical protein